MMSLSNYLNDYMMILIVKVQEEEHNPDYPTEPLRSFRDQSPVMN
ncbi:hypothetical protein SAMN04487969_107108 [Paenibacillus algorifonticola]|uniref:Uncharacterized protein n=1 Tax=Paenibacillus algorifonticola TaxID=684063 RepID=A0A1I2DMP1_9BACL|nr:hypothetical protein SAMN04487969_107108 [Paenibacillus algorifonticola]